MKKTLILAALLVGVATPSYAGVLDLGSYLSLPGRLWEDVRTNSKVEIESSIGLDFQDQESGNNYIGSMTPFAHAGSYLYLGAGAAGRIGDGTAGSRAVALLGAGIRLNDVIRPLLLKGLSKVPWLKDNASFLEGLFNATTVGYTGGHDFNHPNKSKVVINRYGFYGGIELAFGSKDSTDDGAPTASRSSASKSWYLK